MPLHTYASWRVGHSCNLGPRPPYTYIVTGMTSVGGVDRIKSLVPPPHASNGETQARKHKNKTFLELLNMGRWRLVVLGVEYGGRFNQETATFFRSVAHVPARSVLVHCPPLTDHCPGPRVALVCPRGTRNNAHPASSWRTRLPAPTMVSVGDGAGVFSFWLTCAAPGRTKASRTRPLKSVAASCAGETCLASPNARSFPQNGSSRVPGAGNCAHGAQPSKERGRTGR